MKEKVVVITGASAGIGASLARLIGGRGAFPVLAARRAGELQSVAQSIDGASLTVVADVTSRPQVEQILVQAIARVGVTARDHGRIALAGGFASHGEPVRFVRSGSGRASAVWLAGMKLLPESRYSKELSTRFPGR